MSPKELLELNGDIRRSALLDTLRRIDAVFERIGTSYAAAGGLAVRNGAPRTTMDVDILTTRPGWERFRKAVGPDEFATSPDHARDAANKVEIDVLFAGDRWDMPFGLPEPGPASEYDAELGARFLSLERIIELKLAVHLEKLAEFGPELAAKDLSDAAALVAANRVCADPGFVERLHPSTREAFTRVLQAVERAAAKRVEKKRAGP
jgi:hypothetical protein